MAVTPSKPPQPPKPKAEAPPPAPPTPKAQPSAHQAIVSDGQPAVPTPDVPVTAKQPRREYVHAPDGDAAPCGGGGTLSPAFAEKIRDNPNAFGALQCSVCGLRPVSRYDADGDRFQFLWKGTSDPVGKQYTE